MRLPTPSTAQRRLRDDISRPGSANDRSPPRQEAIVEVLVADGVSPFEARVASAAALAALTVALHQWCLSDQSDPMSSRLGAALDVLDGTARR